MNKKIILVVGLLLANLACAELTRNPTAEPMTGPTKGHLRVEWQPGSARDGTGSVVVFRDGVRRQSFSEETFLPDSSAPSLELVDLSGDGYADLLVRHMTNGISSDSNLAYIWVPAKKHFVKSITLSDRGEISPLSTPGCVSSTYMCQGRNGFFTEEFCFKASTGLWRRVRTERYQCPK